MASRGRCDRCRQPGVRACREQPRGQRRPARPALAGSRDERRGTSRLGLAAARGPMRRPGDERGQQGGSAIRDHEVAGCRSRAGRATTMPPVDHGLGSAARRRCQAQVTHERVRGVRGDPDRAKAITRNNPIISSVPIRPSSSPSTAKMCRCAVLRRGCCPTSAGTPRCPRRTSLHLDSVERRIPPARSWKSLKGSVNPSRRCRRSLLVVARYSAPTATTVLAERRAGPEHRPPTASRAESRTARGRTEVTAEDHRAGGQHPCRAQPGRRCGAVARTVCAPCAHTRAQAHCTRASLAISEGWIATGRTSQFWLPLRVSRERGSRAARAGRRRARGRRVDGSHR